MNNIEIYFLKVNIAIALFYLIYRFALANDTFWTARRVYLVLSILLAAVYPFISLAGWLEKQETVQVFMTNYVNLKGLTVTAAPTSIITFRNIFYAIYLLVAGFFVVRMGVQLVSIFKWKLKGKTGNLFGTNIVEVAESITPFSFFNLIFMNPTLHTEPEARQILAHEQTHARQMHSLDVLLGELLTIVCWFNPAAWLLKREIRQNLEFLADNNVLQSGFDTRDYQYHLLQLSYQIPTVPLVNKFNVLPIKKRIIMMNQQKTAKAGLLKYSLIVPLALVLVLSSNAQTVVTTTRKVLSEPTDTTKVHQIKKKTIKIITKNDSTEITTTENDGKTTYQKVEKMPQFPGGEKALMEHIRSFIKYPTDAHEKGIQGTVIVKFVVNKLGKVVNAEILRGVYPSIDAEGLEVVNSMPNWAPGEQKGKKVSVYYTLPISFKLNDGITDKTTADNWRKSLIVIVDGVQQAIGFDFKSIKPEDIESVNVLKSDTEEKRQELIAKYGENASPGVIIIKTKK
jgi:TonB family protein